MIGDQFGGRVGLFALSENFDADKDRLEAHGTTFEEPSRDVAYGRVAVFRDP